MAAASSFKMLTLQLPPRDSTVDFTSHGYEIIAFVGELKWLLQLLASSRLLVLMPVLCLALVTASPAIAVVVAAASRASAAEHCVKHLGDEP